MQEKKIKYSAAFEERSASFTPFVVSVDGVLGHDAQHLMRRLYDQIAMKWEKSHSEVMGWVRARVAFAILCAKTFACVDPGPKISNDQQNNIIEHNSTQHTLRQINNYMGQSPRKWPFAINYKSYKNDSRLNRYNFGTVNAIDFLFSKHHTTQFL